MNTPKSEFIKNFIEQRSMPPFVNASEGFLFNGDDTIIGYLTHIEFLILQRVIKSDNEFYNYDSRLLFWLNSKKNLHSIKSNDFMIGVYLNSKNVLVEFFCLGIKNTNMYSNEFNRLYMDMYSLYGNNKKRVSFLQREYLNGGCVVEFDKTPWFECNIIWG